MKHTCFKRNIFLEGWAGGFRLALCHHLVPWGTGHRDLHDCSGTHIQLLHSWRPLDISLLSLWPGTKSFLQVSRSSQVPPVQAQARAKGPAKPWTCGYRCRFCEQACARRSQLLELPPQKTMRQQLEKEPCFDNLPSSEVDCEPLGVPVGDRVDPDMDANIGFEDFCDFQTMGSEGFYDCGS